MALPIFGHAIRVVGRSLAGASAHLTVQAQSLKTNCLRLLAPSSLVASRFYATKNPECEEKPADPCHRDKVGDPCRDVRPKKPKKKKKEFVSMWEWPECCLAEEMECKLERLDLDHYKMTDNAKRKCQVTWVECGELKIQPRKKCSYEKLQWPQMERRKRGHHRPQTAKEPSGCVLRPPAAASPDCPCFTLAGCRAALKPPKCKKTRLALDCKKYNTPYPAFSECKKPKPKRARTVECRCLTIPSTCEVVRQISLMEEEKGPKKPKK